MQFSINLRDYSIPADKTGIVPTKYIELWFVVGTAFAIPFTN